MNFIRGANPCTRIRFLDPRRSTTDRKLFLQISTLSPQESFPVSADIFFPSIRGCISMPIDRAPNRSRINGVFFFFSFSSLLSFLRFLFFVFCFCFRSRFFFVFFSALKFPLPPLPPGGGRREGGEKQSFRFVWNKSIARLASRPSVPSINPETRINNLRARHGNVTIRAG